MSHHLQSTPEPRESIRFEFTPNPSTLKFVVSRPMLSRGTASFADANAAQGSPLPRRLLAIPGVRSVMISPSFVTVTKGEDVDWATAHDRIHDELHAHFTSGDEAVDASLLENTSGNSSDDPVVKRIQQVIEAEVRPALAMDGGDISFERFQDGVVYVYLRGACSSCPSASMTLKMGIENRLREEIPEVQEVVQL